MSERYGWTIDKIADLTIPQLTAYLVPDDEEGRGSGGNFVPIRSREDSRRFINSFRGKAK